jgi:origin recognition complex subunit 4
MADGNLGITGIQNYLRMKLFSHDFCEHNCGPNPLEDATRKVTQLIEQSIKERESNSFLIVGPQGVGKSTVVNKALLSFGKQHQDKFHLVSLNGFVHTDDHLSLKATIKQLNVDIDVDTDDDSIDGRSQVKSFAASMNYVLEKLHSGSKESTFIVFVLDEFHMFTLHKNQILLYNLFDICQSPVNPVLIIGLTTQPNVVESLEKRVKSRFSHRQVFLFPKIEFDDYLEIFSSLVSLPLSDDRISSFTNCKEWNKQIEELLHDKEVLELLRRLFDHSSNYYIMKQFVVLNVTLPIVCC